MRKIIIAELLPAYNLNVEFDELIGDAREKTKKPSMINIAHPDLVKAFQDIAIDLAATCEQQLYTELEKDAEQLSNYSVQRVKFSSKGEDSIIIFGRRLLKNHQYLDLVTPMPIKLDAKISEYQYAGSLSEKVNTLLQKIDMYLTGEEKGDSNAVGMFADNDLNSHLSSELPEGVVMHANGKPKKGRGKGKKQEETAEAEE